MRSRPTRTFLYTDPILLVVMGLLFGGSTTENEEEIEKLKERVEWAKESVEEANNRAKQAEREVGHVRDSSLQAIEALHELFDELEDKDGMVETLDQPKVVWKATRQFICKLILPTGTTVVHPSKDHAHHGGKKRADQAVVAMFYNPHGVSKLAHSTESTRGHSRQRGHFQYELGETVTPKGKLDKSLDEECTDGIHFFCDKQDAIDWY